MTARNGSPAGRTKRGPRPSGRNPAAGGAATAPQRGEAGDRAAACQDVPATASPHAGQRWRLLLPPEAVVVDVRNRRRPDGLGSLPPGTPVALVGRRARAVARRARVRVTAEYLALPSLAEPVAVSRLAGPSLRWTARTVLTVPSGVTAWHAPAWAAVRVVRALPALLRFAPAGDRLLVGTTTRGEVQP